MAKTKKKEAETKTKSKAKAKDQATTPSPSDLLSFMGSSGLPDLEQIYPLPQEALLAYTMGDTKKRELPDRSFKFLRGINVLPPVFFALSSKGFTLNELQAGWLLMYAANGTLVSFLPQSYSPQQREAEAELDNWDEPNFEIISAAIRFHFPSQHDYLFHQLEPQDGPSAVTVVKTLLTRVDMLRLGKDKTRKSLVEADKKAMAYLNSEGLLTDKERKRLWDLVKTVETPPDNLEDYATYQELQSYQEAALVRLGIWFDKWSSIARRLLKKRSHLITLGLASRRKAKTQEEAPTESQPTTESETSTGEAVASTNAAGEVNA